MISPSTSIKTSIYKLFPFQNDSLITNPNIIQKPNKNDFSFKNKVIISKWVKIEPTKQMNPRKTLHRQVKKTDLLGLYCLILQPLFEICFQKLLLLKIKFQKSLNFFLFQLKMRWFFFGLNAHNDEKNETVRSIITYQNPNIF